MKNHLSLFFITAFLLSASVQSQELENEEVQKKSINIKRITVAPKIDGILDDAAWLDAEEASGFTQFRPEMGVIEKEHQKTVVKIAYNDNAIFIAAYCYDNPEDIVQQFTSRDNFGNSDFFGVILNPNNDAQNDIEFFTFPTGNQADAIASPGIGEDFGWNAVWESAVKTVEDGWIVEYKIPYSALRFSNQNIQTWGLQFHRRFRSDNSQYSWNPIDRTKGNIGIYHGEINGIENITPPTRLSFFPFASAVINNFDSETIEDYNLGLDIKYGISENFTLDATLIPDFSQAGFDNVRLNLGPFEQQFSEQRQFFTEGVDLFSKGNLFYSRRIGSRPTGSVDLVNEGNISEELIDYPRKVNMLNAIKVSGRTGNGLGIGVFNAITERTHAPILRSETFFNQQTQQDEVRLSTREQLVEPLTNYSILVVDQQFNGNSSVSLINTNVLRNGSFRDANVTGLLADISNKRNTYNVRGQVKMSNLNLETGTETGLSTSFAIRKTHGKFRYSFDHSLANTKYDINDLGIQFRNNYNNFGIDAWYQIFEPTEKLNNFSVSTWVNYRQLYKPSTFTGTNFGFNVNGQTKKLMWFGGSINFEPGKQYDYFEPRDFENKRFFIYKNIGNINGWINTDGNKTLSFDLNAGVFKAFDKERVLTGYSFGIGPNIRFNDKFRISYDFSFNNNRGSRGFVTNLNDDIVFGQRDIVTIVNSISGSYNFNVLHALSLTFRNYWSTVDYNDQLYALELDGTLNTNDGYSVADISDPNVNFNTWNLDLGYSWQFAPGSQLSALYRNSLFNFSSAASEDYFKSIDNLFKEPLDQTFSIKVVYYIDYNNVKNIFKGKSNNI